jgi:tetratricopeptide (TPR) repeat protein
MRGPALLLWAGLAGCSADHLAGRGREALDAHDLPGAERWFRRALAKDAGNVDALAGLGWTYNLAGQKAAAKDAFDRCVEVAPAAAECLRGAASISMGQGRYDDARRTLERARAAAPDDPGVESSFALLALVTGDIDGAAERFERLVARLPEAGEHRLGLAEARLRQGRAAEAMDEARAGATLAGTPRRHVAQLWQVYARAAVRAAAGPDDPARCAADAPRIREWLAAADQALDAAEVTGVPVPELPATRRMVDRRASMLDETCPPPAPPLIDEDPPPAGEEGT